MTDGPYPIQLIRHIVAHLQILPRDVPALTVYRPQRDPKRREEGVHLSCHNIYGFIKRLSTQRDIVDVNIVVEDIFATIQRPLDVHNLVDLPDADNGSDHNAHKQNAQTNEQTDFFACFLFVTAALFCFHCGRAFLRCPFPTIDCRLPSAGISRLRRLIRDPDDLLLRSCRFLFPGNRLTS